MKLMTIIACCLLFAYCKKGNDEKNENETKLSFKADGKLYEYKGAFYPTDAPAPLVATAIHRDIYSDGTIRGYELFAYDQRGNTFDRVSMDISTYGAALKSDTTYFYRSQDLYHYTLLFQPGTSNPFTGHDYVNGLENDSVSIHISSIQNGLVNGTFSAIITPVENIAQKMKITEGIIKNVPIYDIKLN